MNELNIEDRNKNILGTIQLKEDLSVHYSYTHNKTLHEHSFLPDSTIFTFKKANMTGDETANSEMLAYNTSKLRMMKAFLETMIDIVDYGIPADGSLPQIMKM